MGLTISKEKAGQSVEKERNYGDMKPFDYFARERGLSDRRDYEQCGATNGAAQTRLRVK